MKYQKGDVVGVNGAAFNGGIPSSSWYEATIMASEAPKEVGGEPERYYIKPHGGIAGLSWVKVEHLMPVEENHGLDY